MMMRLTTHILGLVAIFMKLESCSKRELGALEKHCELKRFAIIAQDNFFSNACLRSNLTVKLVEASGMYNRYLKNIFCNNGITA